MQEVFVAGAAAEKLFVFTAFLLHRNRKPAIELHFFFRSFSIHSSVQFSSFRISVRKVENFSILNLSIHITTNIIAFLFFMNDCGFFCHCHDHHHRPSTTANCHRNRNRCQFNCIYSALSKNTNNSKWNKIAIDDADERDSNEILTFSCRLESIDGRKGRGRGKGIDRDEKCARNVIKAKVETTAIFLRNRKKIPFNGDWNEAPANTNL